MRRDKYNVASCAINSVKSRFRARSRLAGAEHRDDEATSGARRRIEFDNRQRAASPVVRSPFT